MREITKEEKSELASLASDINSLSIGISATEGIEAYNYDMMGLLNKMRDVMASLEYIIYRHKEK